MMKRNVLLLTLILYGIKNIFAQQSYTVLPLPDFIAKVKQHHPLAKVAAITEEKAVANIQVAKGAFDPIIDVEANAKTFNGKNYYRYNNGEFKIPLPVGDFKTGIENNAGQLLNSEVTSGRSSYAGFEIPLAPLPIRKFLGHFFSDVSSITRTLNFPLRLTFVSAALIIPPNVPKLP